MLKVGNLTPATSSDFRARFPSEEPLYRRIYADGPNIQVLEWLIARLNYTDDNLLPRYEASM